jgi:hypothetical protein
VRSSCGGGLRGPGRPPKAPAIKALVVFRPSTLLTRLQRAAEAEGIDVSALLCRLAENFLKRRTGGRR